MVSLDEVEDENKLATILFADIVESSALLDDAPGDEALELMRGALEAMGECVAAAGGTINRVMGDGLMALFGAPRSQEDHALAACLAALAMLEAVAARFPSLRLRVGVHSGDFIVHAVHSGNLRALDATGNVAHLAARIQAAAEPGEAWISEATRVLAGPAVTAEPLGETLLKGQRRPQPLHRLLAAEAEGGRPAPAGEAPLLGRAAELRAIRAARAAPGALLVLGEPGMGKTRLLAEALRGVPALRGAALRLRARDFHAVEPMVLAALGDADGPAAAAWRGAEPPAWARLTPQERRAALVEAGVAALRRWAADTPGGVLLADDVQWLDEGSGEVLRALLPDPPCPLVLLARAGEAPGWMTGLPTLALAPLAAGAATELALWRLGASAPEEVVRQIRLRCGGNPLFIEQAALSPDPRRLPPDVRVILSQRIDALPPPAKRLLETVAAVGEPCGAPLLAACAPEEEEGAVAPLLEGLEAQGFVMREAGRVACRHALFQEVAYGALTARRREALHARIARAAEAQGCAVALLARQARLGALWAEALRHARAAAAEALARFANRDAAAFLEEAIEALERLPEALRPAGVALELRLLLRDPLFRLGRMEALRARLLEAEALAADRQGLAQLRIFRSHQSWLTGDYAAAIAAVEDAQAQAAEDGDGALALRALFQRGLWALGTGELAECAALMARVAAEAEDPRHGGRFGLDAPLVVVARGYQARALAELGAVAAAREAADAATARARLVDRPFSWIFAAFAEGVVLRAEGRPAEAAARLREGLAQCEASDTALMRVIGLMLLGFAECDAGEWAAAEAHLAQSIALGEEMRFLTHQPQRLAMRGRALRALGRAAEAEAALAQARLMAAAQGDRRALG